MLPAGAYEHRVRLERRVEQPDSYGNARLSWATPQLIARLWAAVRPSYGREQLAAGRVLDGMAGVVTLRAWSVTRSITSADRIVFESGPYAGKAFAIIGVLATPDNTEIELTVEQSRD